MKTSLKAILALINEEALVLQTYKDGGGVPTIGVGHTAAAGGVIPKMGNRITIEQGIDLLAKDLVKFERRVLQAVRYNLLQHELDALVMFDFNTGKIDGGTVDDKLNAKNIEAAMATLQQYDKDNGKKLAGLDARRDREEAMFRHGIYPVVTHIKVYDRYPGKMRLVPVSSLDLSAFADSQVPVQPVSPVPAPVAPENAPSPATARPHGLLMAFIELILSIFKGRKIS